MITLIRRTISDIIIGIGIFILAVAVSGMIMNKENKPTIKTNQPTVIKIVND